MIFPAAAWLLLWAGPLRCLEISVPEESAFDLFNDRTMGGLSGTAIGDFNGDGKKDLVTYGAGEVNLFLGDFLGSSGTFTTRANMRALSYHFALLTDLDGDNKDELILKYDDAIHIYRGREREIIPEILDPATTPPELVLTGEWNLLVGANLTDDNKKELMVANASQNGRVCLLMGQSPLPTGTYPMDSVPGVKTFQGKANSGLGSSVTTGDVNGDGQNDLIISAPYAGTGDRLAAGEVYIFFQPASLPNTVDMSTDSSDIIILGPKSGVFSRPYLKCLGIKDFNGDHFPEAVVHVYTKPMFIDGKDMTSGRSIIDLLEGSTSTVSQVDPFPSGYHFTDPLIWGDFDGDGAQDYFFNGFDANVEAERRGVLSSEQGPLPFVLSQPSALSVTVSPLGQLLGLGDLNGDGVDDLIYYTDIPRPQPPGTPFGKLSIIPGGARLWDPAITLEQSAPSSRRVSAIVAVRGEATEMKFSGDIADDDKDRWIPYAGSRQVALTPEPGGKTVRVTFRDVRLRMSDTAQASTSLEAEEPMVTVFNNRLQRGAGRKGAWDCTLTSPGTIRARVYDRMGNNVAEPLNRFFSAGVVMVEWDGLTRADQWAAPGAYILVLEVNGLLSRHNVLIDP